MGIFSSIKNAIWGDDEDDKAVEKKAPSPAPATKTGGVGSQPGAIPITQETLEKQIAAKPGADKLNWKTSIADLMRVVGLDPSYENRKELAHDVGIEDYSGTAEQNIHLHKIVMQKLAIAGGQVPDDLKD